MKKLLFSSAFMLVVLTASAQQKQQESQQYQLPDGFLAVELQVNPFSNDFNTFKMAELKARLFLNNRSTIRIGLGFGFNNDKDTDSQYTDTRKLDEDSQNYSIFDSSTKYTTNAKTLKLSVGYEYHFATAGRLDFYGGVEAGYEGKFYSAKEETSSVTTTVAGGSTSRTTNNTVVEYKKMMPTEFQALAFGGYGSSSIVGPSDFKYNEHNIFANLFTGVDFYVYKGLYIGTELGISFKTGKQENGYFTYRNTEVNQAMNTDVLNTYSSKTGIFTTYDNIRKEYENTFQTPVIDHSAKSTSIKVYVEPAIRLGWIF